jgi:Uma2 family endonuclease
MRDAQGVEAMFQERKQWISPEEYLALERQAQTRSEYWNGQVRPKPSANRAHNLIVVNLLCHLSDQLKSKACEVYASAMRVKVSPSNWYVYPDLAVACVDPQFEDPNEDTLLNPIVMIDVISKSNEICDHGTRFVHYRLLPSLTDYVVIFEDAAAIDVYSRLPDGKWLLSFYQGMDATATLSAHDCHLSMTEVYDGIQWPDERAAAGWRLALREPYAVTP